MTHVAIMFSTAVFRLKQKRSNSYPCPLAIDKNIYSCVVNTESPDYQQNLSESKPSAVD